MEKMIEAHRAKHWPPQVTGMPSCVAPSAARTKPPETFSVHRRPAAATDHSCLALYNVMLNDHSASLALPTELLRYTAEFCENKSL